MIKLQVIGHLGKDAVSNQANGKNVINFNVAHTEKWKDAQGEQRDKTTWLECAYWTERTGLVPYLKKGTQVYVEGTPEVATYPKNDGSTGVSLKVRVFNVQLLGSNNTNNNAPDSPARAESGAYSKGQAQTAADMTEPIDDLPF